ncbi:hypothetical protein A2U01_0089413, partial [Trifolium medium]|nr:hypothetical protein [Trifolium medium]
MGRCRRQCTSSSVTDISPLGIWKLLVSLCHLSTKVYNPGSRNVYPVSDNPDIPVAFRA